MPPIIYSVILVVRVALFPGMIPIHVATFETEAQCAKAAVELDKSTPLTLILSCEVDT